MRVHLSTLLPRPYPEVWTLLERPATLEFIAAPLMRFTPLEPRVWPQCWAEGQYRVTTRLLGVFPLGWQIIDISHPEVGVLRDNGRGTLAHTWNHTITLRALNDQTTVYTDTVEIGAGLLTPFVWVFAQVFYRHRQRRWQRLLNTQEHASSTNGV